MAIKQRDIPLVEISIDGGTQPRSEIDTDIVGEYADAMELGIDFPPIDLFYDGTKYWLADGFHRFHAARKANVAELKASIHTGTRREAVLFSVGANCLHGLRRTNEDKRRAVATLLADPEWCQWSARKIANKCGVAHTLVGDLREMMESDSIISTEVKYTTSTGKTGIRPVKSRRNVESTQPVREESPEASAREPPRPKPPSAESTATATAVHCINLMRSIPTADVNRINAFQMVMNLCRDTLEN